MSEKQILELMEYLNGLGFSGGNLKESIKAKIEQGALSFAVDHRIFYGQDEMSFTLRFVKDQQFNAYRLAEYKAALNAAAVNQENINSGKSRSFSVTEYGTANADLAFNVLTGRLDDLYDKLQLLELDQFPGIDLYPELEKILSKTSDKIEIHHAGYEPEGYYELTIPVILHNGFYQPDEYLMLLRPFPSIEHGVYDGINTADLESTMMQIDWHKKNELFVPGTDGQPQPKPEIKDVMDKISGLLGHEKGSHIASQLSLKFWSGVAYFNTLVDVPAFEQAHTLTSREHVFSIDTKVKTAFNLLCGRAAMLNTRQESAENYQWVRFDFNEQVDDNSYKLKALPGFKEYEVEDILNLIPVRNMDYYPIKNGLLRGDIVAAQLTNDKRILLEANPEHSTVNLYTADMRPIPANLRFDPDWPAPLKTEKVALERKQSHHKYNMIRPKKNHKGKRL